MSSRCPRILITRTRHQASELAAHLERLGAETVLIPMIEVVPPTSFDVLDAAVLGLGSPDHHFDWLLFTSANAVVALEDRRRTLGVQIRPIRIAAIGPATAKAIQQACLTSVPSGVLIPPEYVAESLAETLLSNSPSAPEHFLLLRAEEARDTLPDTLRAAGHLVTIAAAYRNVTPPGTMTALERLFAAPENYPDVITFTSSSTVRNLIGLLESLGLKLPPEIILASIGPVTSATLRGLGHEPAFEAAEPTIAALAAAIAARL